MQPKYENFSAVLLDDLKGTRGHIIMSHKLHTVGYSTFTYSIKTEYGKVAHREEEDVFIDRVEYGGEG